MVEMSNLIDAAVASRPAGLVVSIPDAAALAGSIGRATAAGIPAVSINSGADAYRDLGVLAHIEDASLEAHAGPVTCLLGDNGAGKSTLIKVLAGVHPPTAGRVEVDGEPVTLGSPRNARRHGIATVYQDLAVIPLMSVWRNFFLGREPTVGPGPSNVKAAIDGGAPTADDMVVLDREVRIARTRERLVSRGPFPLEWEWAPPRVHWTGCYGRTRSRPPSC